MGTEQKRAATARGIIDRSLHMVLATADADGRPWASPVYFAADRYRQFFWISSCEATHSKNVEARPGVGIVIFDTAVAVGAGQGVYMEANAEQLSGAELDRGLEVYSSRSVETGGPAWSRDDLPADGVLRMYRATATSHSMLAKDGKPDHRVAVPAEEIERE